MKKPIVFISHISEEGEIARLLKELLSPHFLGLIDFFVSSDGESIKMGEKWLATVSDHLSACSVEIVICSPASVQRPWVNFEAGAGWIRGIPVIPLCHSGASPSKLPSPLNLLQGASLTDAPALRLVVPILAQAIGAASPQVDFTDFVAKVAQFEEQYTFWDKCNRVLGELEEQVPGILKAVESEGEVQAFVASHLIKETLENGAYLERENLLFIRSSGASRMSSAGHFQGLLFIRGERLSSVLQSDQLKVSFKR